MILALLQGGSQINFLNIYSYDSDLSRIWGLIAEVKSFKEVLFRVLVCVRPFCGRSPFSYGLALGFLPSARLE